MGLHIQADQVSASYVSNSVVTNTGDLIVASGSAVVDNLAAGTNEHRLVADSGETLGLKYVADTTNYAITAKGDLLVGTAADTLAPLSVGTNGHVLTADSGEASGVKWAAASGGKILQVVRATDTTDRTTTSMSAVDASISVSITPESATSAIVLIWSLQVRHASADAISFIITDSSNNTISGAEDGRMGSATALSNTNWSTIVIAYDTPGTTSALTYKGRFSSVVGGTQTIRNSYQTGQLYAIEVSS